MCSEDINLVGNDWRSVLSKTRHLKKSKHIVPLPEQALVLLRHLSKTRVVDEEEKGWMFVSPVYPGRPANLASMLKSFQHIWPEIAWVLYPHPGPEADYEHKFTWLLVTAKAKFESLGGDAEKVLAFFYIALSKAVPDFHGRANLE